MASKYVPPHKRKRRITPSFYSKCEDTILESYDKLLLKLNNDPDQIKSMMKWLRENHKFSKIQAKCSLFSVLSKKHQDKQIKIMALYYFILRCSYRFTKKEWDKENLKFGNQISYNDTIFFYPSHNVNKASSIEINLLMEQLNAYKNLIDIAMKNKVSSSKKLASDQKQDDFLLNKNDKFELRNFHEFEDRLTHGMVYSDEIQDWLGWTERKASVDQFFKERVKSLKHIKETNDDIRKVELATKLLIELESRKEGHICQKALWGEKDFDKKTVCSELPFPEFNIIIPKKTKDPITDRQLVLGRYDNIIKYRNCSNIYRVMTASHSIDKTINWSLLINKYMIKCASESNLVFPLRFILTKNSYGNYTLAKFPLQIDLDMILNAEFMGILRISILYKNKKKGIIDYQDRLLLLFRNVNNEGGLDYYLGEKTPSYLISDWKLVRYGMKSFSPIINPTWDEFNILSSSKYLNLNIYQDTREDNIFFFSKFSKEEIEKLIGDKMDLSNLIQLNRNDIIRGNNFVEDYRKYIERLKKECLINSSKYVVDLVGGSNKELGSKNTIQINSIEEFKKLKLKEGNDLIIYGKNLDHNIFKNKFKNIITNKDNIICEHFILHKTIKI